MPAWLPPLPLLLPHAPSNMPCPAGAPPKQTTILGRGGASPTHQHASRGPMGHWRQLDWGLASLTSPTGAVPSLSASWHLEWALQTSTTAEVHWPLLTGRQSEPHSLALTAAAAQPQQEGVHSPQREHPWSTGSPLPGEWPFWAPYIYYIMSLLSRPGDITYLLNT